MEVPNNNERDQAEDTQRGDSDFPLGTRGGEMAQGRRVADLSGLLDMLFNLSLTLAGDSFDIEAIRGIHNILSCLKFDGTGGVLVTI